MRTPIRAPLALLLALLGCASPGPLVPTPPEVRVSRYGSERITREAIRFDAAVAIRNVMRGPLEIERVDYAVDLQGELLFEDSFAELHPMGSRVTQTVTLPFQTAMEDVLARVEGVLIEEAVRVTFRGIVVPVGFDPIPFHAEQAIPIPRLPEVALDGVQGNPLDGAFTVFVRVRNRNPFPLTVAEVDTHLDLNGQRYDLVRTDSCTNLAPSAAGRLALTMQNTRGKGLAAVIGVVRHQALDFTLGGSLSCRTPYGVIYLPLELGSGGDGASR